MPGTLPTFFIIGAPKAGTTSFHHYLEQHPEIQMSAVKEPSFFAPPPDDLHVKRGISRLDRYEQLFDPGVAVRGEASTNYAEYPFREGVPERIAQYVPDAKLIYLVRDPIKRTVSHYHHLVANGAERRSLTEICGDLSDPRTPCVCASLYALQLELYLRYFPQQRVLVIDQAALLSDRRAVLRSVFSFLEVDESFDCPQFDVEFLRGSEQRRYPPWLARFLERTIRPRIWWLPPRLRRLGRNYGEQLFLQPLETTELDADLRSRLQELYSGEVERLRDLTGEKFPSWNA
jgi:hypothetical protein